MPPDAASRASRGFPQTPPIRAGIITTSIDDTIVTPSAHMVNAIVGRELGGGFAFEAGYIGRFGRDLLVRRDLAMPLNLVDTASGMDYFTAAQQLVRATQAAGLTGDSPDAAFQVLANIPYWQNLFPDANGIDGLTATQAMARSYAVNGPDYITSLWEIDQFCEPACFKFGPFAYFMEQYDSLAAISSIGRVELSRDGADAAKAVHPRYPVRHELHVVEVRRSRLERRARQRLRQLWSRGLQRLPDQLLGSGVELRHSDFDVRHQINIELCLGPAVRAGNRTFGGGRGASSTRSSVTGRSQV